MNLSSEFLATPTLPYRDLENGGDCQRTGEQRFAIERTYGAVRACRV
jgi:hypothetical protein